MTEVTLIDGHSGSGKTTLAEQLASRSGAQILRLDALYPGWNGLAEGSRAVALALRSGVYERYNWELAGFDLQIELDTGRPLIIEGCGSLTRENLAAAREWSGAQSQVHSIWLECAIATRRTRALDRDGDMFRPHWENWAQQEREYFADTRPIALAREIIHVD